MNPELRKLNNRVEAVLLVLDPNYGKIIELTDKDLKNKDFVNLKLIIGEKIENLDNYIKIYVNKTGDQVHRIKIKYFIRNNIDQIYKELKGLKIKIKSDDEKVIYSVIENRFKELLIRCKNFDLMSIPSNVEDNVDNSIINIESKDIATATTTNPKTSDHISVQIRKKRESLTSVQIQQLAQIEASRTEQNDVLTEIELGLDDLKNIAESMYDELSLQNKMIDDLDKKFDKNNDGLEKINDRMKDIKSKMSCSLTRSICAFILIVIVLVIIVPLILKVFI
jgi:hypothetical protein